MHDTADSKPLADDLCYKTSQYPLPGAGGYGLNNCYDWCFSHPECIQAEWDVYPNGWSGACYAYVTGDHDECCNECSPKEDWISERKWISCTGQGSLTQC